MGIHRFSACSPRRGAALLCAIAALAAITSLAPARAGANDLAPALEHMQFRGPLGARGEREPPADLLTFEDGNFTSRICQDYGFTPTPYWVRRDDDGLHFLAELHSPENGTIRFKGVFDGETMHATALWTKERWYWTVRQKLFFTGRPVEPDR